LFVDENRFHDTVGHKEVICSADDFVVGYDGSDEIDQIIERAKEALSECSLEFLAIGLRATDGCERSM
jgi:hypothetical protein